MTIIMLETKGLPRGDKINTHTENIHNERRKEIDRQNDSTLNDWH